jgi:putrescine aminotransferase
MDRDLSGHVAKATKPDLMTLEDCEKLSLSDVRALYKTNVSPGLTELLSTFGFGNELIAKAEGMFLHTDDGRKITDMTGGMGVLSHGHNHPKILKARQDFQQSRKMEVHKSFFGRYQAGLSHNLAEILPDDLDFSFFCNSGAEAIDGAIKLAYKYHEGKRKHILHSDRSFHGKLLGALSVSQSDNFQAEGEQFKFPQIPDTAVYKFDTLESVQEQIDSLRQTNGGSDIYAILVEPLSASTICPSSKEFLEGVREICTREDIVLIFDEIYTGWGKCGEVFYFMNYDICPDILTVSKSFGGGKSSISSFITRRPMFMKAYGQLNDATLHSTTYGGFGEECATAIEAINVLFEENLITRSRELGQQLRAGFERLKENHPKMIVEIRGAGSLYGVVLNDKIQALQLITKMLPVGVLRDPTFIAKLVTASIIDELYRKEGYLTYLTASGEVILNVAPSLIATDDDLEGFFSALDRVLSSGVAKLAARFVKNRFQSR